MSGSLASQATYITKESKKSNPKDEKNEVPDEGGGKS